jgi:hypothetical protein
VAVFVGDPQRCARRIDHVGGVLDDRGVHLGARDPGGDRVRDLEEPFVLPARAVARALEVEAGHLGPEPDPHGRRDDTPCRQLRALNRPQITDSPEGRDERTACDP